MSSKNRNLKKKLNKMNKQLGNDYDVIDFTTSLNSAEMQFIKSMVQDIFPEVLDLDSKELCKWCKERNIYHDMDLYNYIASVNESTGYFDWLTK